MGIALRLGRAALRRVADSCGPPLGCYVAAGVFLMVSLAGSARAAVDAWDAGAATDFFDLDANWADNGRPLATDSVVFSQVGTYNVLFDQFTDSTYGGSPHVLDFDTLLGNVSFKTDSGPTRRALFVDAAGGPNHIQVLSGSLSLGEAGNANKKFELVAGNNIEIQTGALNVYQGSRLAGDILAVGSVGTTGSLLVSGAGATVNTMEGRIASEAGTTGTATVTGVGSRWDITNGLFIGLPGDGTLNVSAGGIVSNEFGNIGLTSGSTGTVTVTDAGSQWNTKTLGVGGGGTGILNISAGGVVSSIFGAIVGEGNGSTGAVAVSGAGSQWNNSFVTLGESGTATLNVSEGGVVSGSVATIADTIGSTGTVTVTGAGSQWNCSDRLQVGYRGTGRLDIAAGGVVSNSNGRIGSFSGSTGTVTVTGAGSQWNSSSDLYVGVEGAGTLSVEAGGGVSNRAGLIGFVPSSSGTVTVTGAGSQWKSLGGLILGGSSHTIDGGVGTLNVATAETRVQVGNDAYVISPTNTPEIIVSDSGANGVLTVRHGSTITNAGEAVIGGSAGHSGTATITGAGSQWDIAGILYVGNSGAGTLNVAAGGVVMCSTGAISNSSGSTGTVTVTGADSHLISNLLSVGERATGTLNILAGGAVTSSLNGYIGGFNGSTGTVTVADPNSRWNLSGILAMGDVTGGIASLTIGGGGAVTQTGSGEVYIGHATTGSAEIEINNGGTFTSGTGITTVYNTGLIDLNPGGTYNANGDLRLDGGKLSHDGGAFNLAVGKKVQVGNLGVVETLGGVLAAPTLETNAGSAVNVGQVTPALASTMNLTTWTANGGTALVAPGSTLNVASVTFNPGATLHVDGGGTGNVTNAMINGGTTLGDGTLNLLGSIDFGDATTLGVPTAFRGGSSVSFGGNPNFDIQISRRAFVDAGVTFNPGAGTHRLINQAASAISLEPNSVVGIPLVNQGAIRLSENTPFATVTVASFEQAATGTIFFDLLSPNQLDHFNVTGAATLGGTLDVQFQPGASPQIGQQYDLFNWNGGVSGTFASLALPALAPAYVWDASQLYTSGVLVIAPRFTADFDEDGDVDNKDLTVNWQAGFGSLNAGHMQGDADNDADADGADFLAWQRQLGSVWPATAATAAAPEPETATMLLLSLAALQTRCRRQRAPKSSSH